MSNATPAIPVSSKLSFGGHESFPFRLGWLRKGVTAAKEFNAFNAPDAVVKLGVGKNMVRSIRTWCLATQLLEEGSYEGTSRIKHLLSTPVANLIFSDEGDPYMEDSATLWLVHWLLATNPDRLSLWRMAFMESRENEFTKSDLVRLAERIVEREGAKAESTQIARDVDVFVRTYLPGRTSASEEDFSCPLTELGLIAAGGGDRYSFVIGPKSTLPDEVFAFALLQFLRSREAHDCSLSDATYVAGSPGQAFKLDEDTVVEHMRSLAKVEPGTWLVDVDGPIRRIGYKPPANEVEILAAYYRRMLD